MTNVLKPQHVRAARALLAWSQQDLASAAGVGVSTVADFERGQRTPMPNNAQAIREALEAKGLSFVDGGVTTAAKPAAPLAEPGPGMPVRWINATDLTQWGERRDAQNDLPELISRLIYASCGFAARLRFPVGDSIHLPGWDGLCETDHAVPFVPAGCSAWELGVQRTRISDKAEADYAKRSGAPKNVNPAETAFIFVTPHRWPGKTDWAKAKAADGVWREVRVIDADDLIQWLDACPAVAQWLAIRIGRRPAELSNLDEVWDTWSLATEPRLSPDLILTGRDAQATAVLKWLGGAPALLSVQAEAADEAMAFLHAAIGQLPAPYSAALHSRCLVAGTDDVARDLMGIGPKLIVVLNGGDPGLAAGLVKDGHHVYAAYGSEAGLPDGVVRLARPWRHDIETALVDLGVARERAQPLAADAGRSLSILRRIMPAAPGRRPAWAMTPSPILLAAMLAGAWNGDSEADRRIIERLAGKPYPEVEATLAPLAASLDGPLRRSGSMWTLASLRDAWFLLAPGLTDSQVERHAAAFREVLGVPDPAFDISADQRWRMDSETGRASAALRRGLAEAMIALGVFHDRAVNVSNAARRAEDAVRALLRGADERLWWSLSDDFSRLAEAAPSAFLKALDEAQDAPEQPLRALFRSEEGRLGPSEYLADLLWALEMLAWSPDCLARVVQILALLAERDPGGRMANRPSASLRRIFLVWNPQTHASEADRLRVLDGLLRRHPEVGWETLLALAPTPNDMLMPSHLPQWRDFAGGRQESVTRAGIIRGYREIGTRLLDGAGVNAGRWKALLEVWENFDAEWQADAAKRLAEAVPIFRDPATREDLRGALRELLDRHRGFADAEWAMREEDLKPLDPIYEALEPEAATARHAWLFQTAGAPHQHNVSWKVRERVRAAQQEAAAGEIVAENDAEGVLRFAQSLQYPGALGRAIVACDAGETVKTAILMAALDAEDANAEMLAQGMLRRYGQDHGSDWVERLFDRALAEGWSARMRLRIALILPMSAATWMRLAEVDADLEREYWKRIWAWTLDKDADPDVVCGKLMAVGRSRSAIEWLASHIETVAVSGDLLIRVLDAAVQEPSTDDRPASHDATMFSYHIGLLFKRLDEDGSIGEAELVRLEWAYFRVLRRSERPPRTLGKAMASDPELFVQILCTIFRPAEESGVADPEPADREAAACIAKQAYFVLHHWSRIPGSDDAGEIDGAALEAWVKEARRLCARAGRGAIGDQKIGEILAAARRREGESWPPEPVREIIEICRSRDVELGFQIGVYNRRGVTSRSLRDGGVQERVLARTYRADARALALDWPRTAATLERIAESYEHDAVREDQRAEQGDW
ncbi:helix-turn-helix domain-containing protein [Azospirillum halopraeferens]|uniref:helix-turn-helix domain-containing protein n=1 Tax=Azospirillum halopraeferens TaxID=34010 RepID=UPI00048ACBFF|nr:helix-turn-helix transcriptional regulator [Azospirillum halopraeferens]